MSKQVRSLIACKLCRNRKKYRDIQFRCVDIIDAASAWTCWVLCITDGRLLHMARPWKVQVTISIQKWRCTIQCHWHV